MLWKNRLYFLSDRDGAWQSLLSKFREEIKALTRHREWGCAIPNW